MIASQSEVANERTRGVGESKKNHDNSKRIQCQIALVDSPYPGNFLIKERARGVEGSRGDRDIWNQMVVRRMLESLMLDFPISHHQQHMRMKGAACARHKQWIPLGLTQSDCPPRDAVLQETYIWQECHSTIKIINQSYNGYQIAIKLGHQYYVVQ